MNYVATLCTNIALGLIIAVILSIPLPIRIIATNASVIKMSKMNPNANKNATIEQKHNGIGV